MGNHLDDYLGNYRLIRLLGSGELADVYLGEHLYLKSQAAIKVLHTALPDADVANFLSEARHLVSLTHPRIVRVLDFAVAENVPFLVMEYAQFGSVRTRYPKGSRLPLETIVSYVQQVADALQYIHDKKLVHRDVKPENMLLLTDNEIVLSDLGISAIAHPTSSMILRGQAGTPAYMAPEQIRRMPCPASDQYALGIVVYEWLCGTCPFQGNELDLLRQQIQAPPPPLRERVPTILPALEQVLLIALNKDPQQRFAHIRAFATAIARASETIEQVPTAPVWFQPASSDKREISPPQLTPGVLLPNSFPLHETGVSAAQNELLEPLMTLPEQPLPVAVPGQASLTPSASSTSNPSAVHSVSPFLRKFSFPGNDARLFSHGRFSPRKTFLVLGVLILFLGSAISLFYFAPKRPANPPQKSVIAGTPTRNTAATATVIAANPDPYPPHRGKLVIYDPLNTNKAGNNWNENSDPSVGTGCIFIGGAYHVVMPPHYGGPCFARATDFRDFTYQIQFTFVKAAPNWSGGGIVFRAKGDSYYYFEVFESGRYTFDGCSGNNCTLQLASGLGPNQIIPSFHAGLNQSNTIAVVAIGNTFDVYVNGQHIVGPVSDNSYSQGMIGVYGEGGFDVNNVNNHVTATEVVYRDMKVWQL